ncbi:MAG: hypothetical protein NC213_09350 [Acetobacter sp.]|nr:hypothetical protein [Bacteroides sp.]MCM1341936.1 hypothetical protein [Acetobacter sp.]MCM1434120.1 hypothetical protein [Clostridiales bacterium]
MKKSFKQILTGISIWAVTLLVGFSLTSVCFSIADKLTRNEMRIMFVIDIAIILAIGTAAWFIYESKTGKKIRDERFEKRHNERIEKNKADMAELEKIIEQFAA